MLQPRLPIKWRCDLLLDYSFRIWCKKRSNRIISCLKARRTIFRMTSDFCFARENANGTFLSCAGKLWDSVYRNSGKFFHDKIVESIIYRSRYAFFLVFTFRFRNEASEIWNISLNIPKHRIHRDLAVTGHSDFSELFFGDLAVTGHSDFSELFFDDLVLTRLPDHCTFFVLVTLRNPRKGAFCIFRSREDKFLEENGWLCCAST